MRRAFRWVAATTAVVVAGLAVFGSGSSGTAATAPITYTFWGSPERAEKVSTIVDLFAEGRPDRRVATELAEYTTYIERLTVRAAGGELACALGMQSTFFTPYAEEGLLRPLDDLIASGQIDVSDIPENVLESGRIDGVQYMIPTGTFVRVLAYNADLVAASGAPAPTDDMTWDEYGAWLREVQSGLPDGVHATEIEGPNMFSFTSWVAGHGQEMFDEHGLAFDEALLTEWFRFWLDLTADGVTMPASSLIEQTLPLELMPLAQGEAAVATRDIPHMIVTENVLAANGEGTAVAQVSMPSEAPERSANVLGANGISIAADCHDVPTTAAFTDFFANDPGAALAFQSNNGILTNTQTRQALLADQDTPDDVKRSVATLNELDAAGDLTTTTYPTGYSSLTTELARLYEHVAFGEMQPDEAAAAFFSAARYALDN